MTKDFENYLINNGYKLFTAKNQPSTVFDYLIAIRWVAKWENKTIDELAESISEIYPKYESTGEHSIRGKMRSRSIKCGLRQFHKFVMESKAA